MGLRDLRSLAGRAHVTPAAIASWMTEVVRALVSLPEAVVVLAPDSADHGVLLELRVAEPDIGRVVGRDGATIDSLRHLAQVVGARHRRAVFIDLPQTRARLNGS
jgi:uncharacterized protein